MFDLLIYDYPKTPQITNQVSNRLARLDHLNHSIPTFSSPMGDKA